MVNYFLVFLTVNLIAATVNHIDDTDETYGYWEPLHFFLEGHGMQTWEYAPEYAIRPYSFIAPFWLVGRVLKAAGCTKMTIFLAIRILIGVFSALAETFLVNSVSVVLGSNLKATTALFIVCSAGIFFTVTSFLPSALCMTLIMFAFAAWLRDMYVLALTAGCLAVLGTGWPFVGVLLGPLGLHMLYQTFSRSGIAGVFLLVGMGCAVLISTGVPPVFLDTLFYGRRYEDIADSNLII